MRMHRAHTSAMSALSIDNCDFLTSWPITQILLRSTVSIGQATIDLRTQ